MQKEILPISTSILIGALLISASILFASSGSIKTSAKQEALDAAPGADTIYKLAVRRDAPTIGTGKVVIVEFADFQCPYCQKYFQETYPQIKKDYIDTGKVSYTFRHFPLTFHVNAQIASEAAECANQQGEFWQFHDLLFTKGQADGTGLDLISLKKYAVTAGLDTVAFSNCLSSGKMADIVKADLAEGQKNGVSGTPSFFINGKLLVGAQPYPQFKQAIEEALKEVKG